MLIKLTGPSQHLSEFVFAWDLVVFQGADARIRLPATQVYELILVLRVGVVEHEVPEKTVALTRLVVVAMQELPPWSQQLSQARCPASHDYSRPEMKLQHP